MPILKEYAESNDKTGYFVHAPISGKGHPLPLQAPEITEKIYRVLGYEPIKKGPGGGVEVPNELTWTLHNVGLHWTENSGPQSDPSELDFDKLRDEAGPDLTEHDIETILSITKEHEGQYHSRVEDLREELENKSEKSDNSGGILSDIVDSINETSDNPSFSDSAENLLEEWEPGTVKSEDYETDTESGLAELFYTQRSEHRERLASVPNLEDRLLEYESHSLKVSSARGISIEQGKGRSALKISFETDDESELDKWVVTDYRGSEKSHEFKIDTSISDRKFTFEITDHYISDFEMAVTNIGVDKFDLPPDDFWGYEVEEQDPNEIMHTLISDVTYLIPQLEKFFDEMTSYSIESTDPDDNSVYLP